MSSLAKQKRWQSGWALCSLSSVDLIHRHIRLIDSCGRVPARADCLLIPITNANVMQPKVANDLGAFPDCFLPAYCKCDDCRSLLASQTLSALEVTTPPSSLLLSRPDCSRTWPCRWLWRVCHKAIPWWRQAPATALQWTHDTAVGQRLVGRHTQVWLVAACWASMMSSQLLHGDWSSRPGSLWADHGIIHAGMSLLVGRLMTLSEGVNSCHVTQLGIIMGCGWASCSEQHWWVRAAELKVICVVCRLAWLECDMLWEMWFSTRSDQDWQDETEWGASCHRQLCASCALWLLIDLPRQLLMGWPVACVWNW